MLHSLTHIELLVGAAPIAARAAATRTLRDRAAALGQIARVEPPAMTADVFRGHLRFIQARLRALLASGLQEVG